MYESTDQGSINQLSLTALASDAPSTSVGEPLPGASVMLGAPSPNPARGGAGTFPVRLEGEGTVVLDLHHVSGRLVARRTPERLASGTQLVSWAPRTAGAGVYVVRLRTAAGAGTAYRWVVLVPKAVASSSLTAPGDRATVHPSRARAPACHSTVHRPPQEVPMTVLVTSGALSGS